MTERVVVVGAGRMGIPLAQALAMGGCVVELVDLKERTDRDWAELIVRARKAWARGALLLGDSTGTFWKRLRLRRGYGRWLKTAGYLFEALPEEVDLKRQVYRKLGRWLKPECLVGSTTSHLAPADLAPSLAYPERFLLTHWLHPALVMPLVEVAPGEATAPEAVEQMLALLRQCGKEPVVLAGRPGLVTARLEALLHSEAAKMAGEGLGSPAEVDRAVRLGVGFRLLVGGLPSNFDGEDAVRQALGLRAFLGLGGE